MDNPSLAYREGHFPKIFDAARSNRLSQVETIRYSDSLQKLRDTQAGIAFTAKKNREEGIEIGIAKEREKSINIMASLGIAPETIADRYGISTEEVLKILHS